MVSKALTILASVAAISEAAVIGNSYKPDFEKIGTQTEIFKYIGGAGPHFSYPFDFGISKEIPETCNMTQVQVFGRHGERYPTTNNGNKILKTWYKLSNYTGEFNGSLSFLSDYEIFIQNASNFDEETTSQNIINPINPYSGEMDAKKHAREFLAQYEDLIKDTPDFAMFTSNSRRCHDTAQYFIDALGDDYNVTLNIISEDAASGANSLTPRNSCAKFNESENDELLATYSEQYLSDVAERLNEENKGLNLTKSDATNLFNWCAYELNVRGYSYMCDIFTRDELIHYSYADDLDSYYSMGNGNSLGPVAGAVLFNASVNLLQQSEELDQRAWLSFTHDSDLMNYIAAVGLFDNGVELDTSSVPFLGHIYRKSWIVPQGGRLYTQKFTCGNETYIRYVINDVVIPLNGCVSGPGFSCPEEDFYSYAAERINNNNYVEKCGSSNESDITSLSFYWDYKEVNYNAPLFKG